MASVAVVGSINMDLVARAAHFPHAGETVPGHAFRTIPGGKGANQAVAARRMGADVTMIGRVGDDAFGSTLRQTLAGEGIDTRFVIVTEAESTGVALITVADGGENTIVVVPGANGRVSATDVETAREAIAAAAILLLQLEVPLPTVERAAQIAREHGVPVILNAAPARPLGPQFLAGVDYLVVNETEVREVTGTPSASPEAAARAVQAAGARDVVVTLGADGSLLVPHSEPSIFVPAFAVTAVDTTAAGDAFVGAFAVALAAGVPAAEALRWGNAAGALAATRDGAQPSLPDRAEVEALLARGPIDSHAGFRPTGIG